MKTYSNIIIAACLIFLSSCVEEFDIKVDGQPELIVIDAVVTDIDSVQTVYIRRDREVLLQSHVFNKYPPIKDVTVHIEDDNGWSGDFEDVSENWEEIDEGRVFQLEGHQFEPGRTYTITVHVGDRVFKATETMIPLPDIKGLRFYSKNTKDDGSRYQPMIYFTDNQPDVENYYLFSRRFDVIRCESESRYIPLQRLSDVGFRGDLDGIALSVGYGAEEYFTYDLELESCYYFDFMTISKSNYNYYGVMEDNINNDGGVYKPSPTSPLTNFSGDNVQGQFIAASRIGLQGKVTLDNIIDR
ncbi:MAG: DUF4249 domain-containing protein [Bacteroidales bacterium]|nr:DUF4249 domain-containing protein [Bacteroidales bacterium]